MFSSTFHDTKKESPLVSSCNPNQKQAVLFDHGKGGPLFVLAGAGSGKTFVLTNRIVYLIQSGVKPVNLVALTFTEAAAAEMSERAAVKLKELGFHGVECPKACTFHSLGLRLIKDKVSDNPNWARLGFKRLPRVLDASEREHFIREIKRTYALPGSLDQISQLVESPFFPSRNSDELQGKKLLVSEKSGPEVLKKKLRTRFRTFLLEQNALTFGDMVYLAIKLLKENPEVLKYYQDMCQYVLVDEYQDTSPDQLELVRLLAAPQQNLFCVGDDDQAIYGFRGADPDCINRLFDDFPGLSVIKLEINYRSTSSILSYANTIFKTKPRELRKKLVPGKTSDRTIFRHNYPVVHKICHTSLAEGKWITSEMQRLRESEGLDWKDFAILYRLNRQAAYYQSFLKHAFGEEAVSSIRFQTIHGSKGLQYPVVFLVGLENGTFPHKHRGRELDERRFEEEKRLFYVGVTRAESLLYLSSCRKRMTGGKMRKFEISPFLLQTGTFLTRMKLKVLLALVR
ncbi:ATP-dependent helicase [Fibrobacterota bacterium]